MAFKRLIGMITVKNGRVVKSYGYGFWRPGGRLRTALVNLDRWQADEIVILDISGRDAPDQAIIDEIAKTRIATPLVYGGGIRTVKHLRELLAAGCERFVVESLIFHNPRTLEQMAELVGMQALIGSLPLCVNTEKMVVDPVYAKARWGLSDRVSGMDEMLGFYNELPIAEVLITDMASEGYRGRFSLFSPEGTPSLRGLQKGIIWFGGLDLQKAALLLSQPETVGVAFGHTNLEREVAIPRLRRLLLGNVDSQQVRRARVAR